ncbi:hypothetical protein PVAP13_9NG588100 [Panicum virgatum]|uniref:Uncharacterized protein n=1 Tax=Panicum virgatum TaxID=38727 RepID=A0A8T0N1I5_PANVG|nr:hypothetical protein PVAP13_9NG588100 [Panicum virgatum]
MRARIKVPSLYFLLPFAPSNQISSPNIFFISWRGFFALASSIIIGPLRRRCIWCLSIANFMEVTTTLFAWLFSQSASSTFVSHQISILVFCSLPIDFSRFSLLRCVEVFACI